MEPDPVTATHAFYRLYCAHDDGSPRPSHDAEPLWWAWEWVDRQLGDRAAAVGVLDLLLHEPGVADDYRHYVAAGPLEDVLAEGDAEVLEAIALRCRQDPSWAAAAAGVWLGRYEWTRLPELLRRFVPEPPDASPTAPRDRRPSAAQRERPVPRPSVRNRPRRPRS